MQSTLQAAIETFRPHNPIILHGAGRTDTGVHALGQVVSFRMEGGPPTERLAIALNSLLPSDVSVANAEEVEEDFHARFSAQSRSYSYLIWTRRTRSAIWGRYSMHVRQALDVPAMRDAARFLIGTHDFAAFARSGGDPGPTTVRDVQRLSIRRLSDGRILFVVTANGFLRAMVRNFVGVLLAVGMDDLSPRAVEDILETRDRARNPIAPASPYGLCLRRVGY